ncbi:MAG: ferredoxin [Acidobacteriota bacterium]
MLRTDRETEHDPPRPRTRSHFVARTAHAAINETERRLCGSGAVSRPAMAEGLALVGRRAASLLVPDTANSVGDVTASARAPWVHHRLGSGPTSGFAFELTASTTQDAVDHCLVAHDLARRIGAPGLCTYDSQRSGPLDLVRLPDDTMIREFDREPAGEAKPVSVEPEAILREATRAFQHISSITGRPLAAITCDGAEPAEYALVTSGAGKAAAQRLARALELSGVPCRIVCIHLARPFPASALSSAVAGLKRVLLIPSRDNVLEMTRRSLADGGQTEPAVLLDPADDDSAVDAARQAFGFPASHGREAETTPTAAPIGLTARPTGGWAEGFLLEAAARLGAIDEIALGGEGSNLVVGHPCMEPADALPAALALCAHPSYLETGGLLSLMAHGGTLVIVSAGPIPDAWWDDLEPATRATILARDLHLSWLDLSNTPNLDLRDPDGVRRTMLDGFLSAGATSLSRALGREIDGIREPSSMQRVEPQTLEAARAARGSDFRPTPRLLPRMPAEQAEPDDAGWRDAARRFHLTGDGAHSAAEPTLAEPLHPAVFDTIDAPARQESRYPLFVRVGETDEPGDARLAVPFETRVATMLEEFKAGGEAATILTRHLPRLSSAVGRVVSRNSGPSDPGPVIAEALDAFRRGFELSDAAATALGVEIERLRGHLDEFSPGATLVGLDETTLPSLYAAAVRSVRRRRRTQLMEEVGSLVQRLEELLSIDDGHAPEGLSAKALESGLGAGAGLFFDSQKLARNLPRHRGSVRLGSSRRRRIEHTLGALREARNDETGIDLILVQSESDAVTTALPGVRVVVHPHGLEAAIGLFDGLAERSADLFRALRVARLEVDGAYDPKLHDAPLARFGWQGLTADELLSLPRLVVLETGERLRGADLGDFSELLRSGRPVHVLVAQSTAERSGAETWQGLAGFHPGLGYLAVAHREAFVVESSLVCPERLVRDLERMATSLRPAAALVAVPTWNGPVPPWVQLLAAEQGRAIPCFSYDPEAGPHWAARFNLDGNPQPQRPWPLHPVRYLDAQGVETSVEQPFTFAHAVALDPAYRGHFRIVPSEAWSAEQVELADYLAAPVAAVARKIPFIWVVTDESRLARALITRELAYACRDRVRAWRILQELAGTDNEYARRAAEAARAETRAAAETEREAMESEHVVELERVRTEAAGEAMDRLARVLMDLDAVPIAAESPSLERTADAETVPAETVEETVSADEETEEEDVSFDDPYVDSALCTSCQECLDINPRLFKYDANKQAFITDATHGTYEELVRAAEVCPARCIHPGLPGDESANDDLISRAAKFN